MDCKEIWTSAYNGDTIMDNCTGLMWVIVDYGTYNPAINSTYVYNYYKANGSYVRPVRGVK